MDSNDTLKALTAKPFSAPPPPPPPLQQEDPMPEPPPSLPPVTMSAPVVATPKGRPVGLRLLAAGLGLVLVALFLHHRAPHPAKSTASKVLAVDASPRAARLPLVLLAPPTETTTPLASVPAVPPPAPAAAPKNGYVQTFASASGKPVFIDGTRVGSGGTRIETTCGKHLVAVGSGKPKAVVIPCNFTSVTVGSPDGT
jgi:hypothetical protein